MPIEITGISYPVAGGGSTVFVPLSEFLLSDGSQTIDITSPAVLFIITNQTNYNVIQRYDYSSSTTRSTYAGKLYYLIENINDLTSGVRIVGKDLPFFSIAIDAHAFGSDYGSATISLHKNLFSIDF